MASTTLPSVNRVVYDTSFTEDAYNEIPESNRLTNLMKLVVLFSNRFASIQTEAITLSKSRLLSNASGDMVDTIASRFFIERYGRSDDDLKAVIKMQALKQGTEGTRSDIYNLLYVLSGENGFVKIWKGDNNYVECVITFDCIEVADISTNLEGLFPVNTNLKMLRVPSNGTPFGFGSVAKDLGDYDKIAGFGSVTTDSSYIGVGGVLPATVVDNEIRGSFE